MDKRKRPHTKEHNMKIGIANLLTCTPATRKRYSLMYKGKKRPDFAGKKHPLWGKYHTEESKEKMRKAHKGKKLSRDHLNNLRNANRLRRGRKMPPDVGHKISLAKIGKSNTKISGNKNWNWKGGISPERDKIRHSMEYRDWVRKVFIKDKYKDQKYGGIGGKLVAHHILNFSDYPKLRFSVDNGITLSKKAHDEFHKKYGKHHNTKEQLLEFLTNN